ncbi:hypothetical protein D6789_04575 [Candidatus Woesearchaeota archaeon]|nr:MAG: hypothetical protein D6789_04575 [Candidatus Woesearchaeota archaeon]
MSARTSPVVIPTVFATKPSEFHKRFELVTQLARQHQAEVQIDFMDGQFVRHSSPPISSVPALPSELVFEAHLMLREPRHCLPLLKEKGFARVIVHVEAHHDREDVRETVLRARALRLSPLLALNPTTPLEEVLPFTRLIDGVLFLGVEPGAEHQHFITSVYEKVEQLRALDEQVWIQVDGGVTPVVAKHLAALGVNAVNSGSYVSASQDPAQRLALLEQAMRVPRKRALLQRRKLPLHDIRLKANTIRQRVVTMLAHAQSGHTAGSLGMADVLATLYFHVLKYDPARPEHPDRDYVFLSNGHICPVWYATLAEAGFFPSDDLFTFRRINASLQGHPHVGATPGVENSGGPLAQGLSQAAGAAKALRIDGKQNRVFCLCSDGEHDEGQAWEAALFAAHHKLDNLICIMDRNNIQIDGFTDHVMNLEPLAAKYRAFNWNVYEVDGHDVAALLRTIGKAMLLSGKPTMIIAKTIPGKGVREFEGKPEWHGKPPSEEQAGRALRELERERKRLEGHYGA